MSTSSTVPLGDSTNTPSGPQIQPTAQDFEQLKAELASMKGLVQGLRKNPSGRRKRKRKQSADDDTETEAPATNKVKETPSEHSQDFATHGRMIMRFIGPYMNLEDVFIHGLKVDTALEEDETEESPENKRLTDTWILIHEKFPGFHDLMLSIHKDLPLIQSIARQMTDGIEGARADDTGTVKPRIISWIPPTPAASLTATSAETPAPSVTPTAIDPNPPKNLRGMSDPVIALLLLPLEFKDNPHYPNPVQLIVTGKLDLIATQLPCFLFPPGQADDDSAVDTLLTGPLLLCAAKAMLMGPSSALQGDGWHQGKPGNAQLIGLKTFTARIIAYIACQVRFNLSSQNQWNRMDGQFNYEEFFWYLVSQFDDEPFAAKTIALYNRVVLGRASGLAAAPVASTSAPQMTHMERLKAARAARAASS